MKILAKLMAAASVGLAVLAVTTACGSSTTYQGVCVDKSTHKRVNDNQCQHEPSGGADAADNEALTFWWIYYMSGQSAPGVGSAVTGGVSTPPSGSTVNRGGVSPSGGSISDDEDENDTPVNKNTGGSNSGDQDEQEQQNSNSGVSGGEDEDEDGEG